MKQKNKKQTDILEKVKEILDKKKKKKSVSRKIVEKKKIPKYLEIKQPPSK